MGIKTAISGLIIGLIIPIFLVQNVSADGDYIYLSDFGVTREDMISSLNELGVFYLEEARYYFDVDLTLEELNSLSVVDIPTISSYIEIKEEVELATESGYSEEFIDTLELELEAAQFYIEKDYGVTDTDTKISFRIRTTTNDGVMLTFFFLVVVSIVVASFTSAYALSRAERKHLKKYNY